MATLTPKDFIKQFFIKELESIIKEHPYISFMVIGIGIEFLGKCINESLDNFTKEGGSKNHFEYTIKKIPIMHKYQQYLSTYDLYGYFRCGLLHSAIPDYPITLSSKNEQSHLYQVDGRLNLKVEDFFADFKTACEFVINKHYAPDNKMEKPFLYVPSDIFNSGTGIASGYTSSLQIPQQD